MDTLSVNAVLDRLDGLVGTKVAVFSQLSLDFERHCISHLPRAARLPESNSTRYTSSIWTRFDLDALGQREQWLMQFDGRSVVVQGTLYGPIPVTMDVNTFAFGRLVSLFVRSQSRKIFSSGNHRLQRGGGGDVLAMARSFPAARFANFAR